MNTGPTRMSNAAPLVGTPTVQAAPTPADKAATPVAQPSANGFAELLRRSRGEAPKPAASAPAPSVAPRGETADSTEAADTASIESHAAPANAARARSAAPKGAAAKAAVDAPEQGSETTEGAIDDDGTVDVTPTAATALPCDRVDPRTVAALAVDAPRRLPPASATQADDATGSAAGDPPATVAMGDATRSSLGHARGTAAVEASDERRSSVEAGRDAALGAGAGADARLQAALAEAIPAPDTGAPSPVHDRSIDALAASLAAATTTRASEPVSSTNAAVALALPNAIDAPDFAAALGVRVSVLVHDGVQQAELHLNPAETGPVSIHISLDGTAARVDFGADHAATRAAIERGLPELASALRDAGFTLAGGGVSQHAGGRASDDDGARSARRLDGDRKAASSPVAVPPGRVGRIAAGGVDLYA